MAVDVVWQPTLFGVSELAFDASYARHERIELDPVSWVDHAPGWVAGSNHLDPLVTGGKTQHTWEHAVPKVAKAGPRISLAYRHGMQSRGYGDQPRKVAAKKRWRGRKSTIARL